MLICFLLIDHRIGKFISFKKILRVFHDGIITENGQTQSLKFFLLHKIYLLLHPIQFKFYQNLLSPRTEGL